MFFGTFARNGESLSDGVYARVDFHFIKRGGGEISCGVQAAPLSELRQGLGIRVKDFHNKIGGVKRNFGGVELFIKGVREILGEGGWFNLPNPQ